jgi:septal ring factor EnvC (AmiA/AmiB activator)
MTPAELAADLRSIFIDEKVTSVRAREWAEVIQTLVVENERLRAALAERDAEIGKLHAAMADLQDLESNARQKCDHWFERYQAKDAVIAAQRKVLEQALEACKRFVCIMNLLDFENDPTTEYAKAAITAIQEQLK